MMNFLCASGIDEGLLCVGALAPASLGLAFPPFSGLPAPYKPVIGLPVFFFSFFFDPAVQGCSAG
ncbi:hypothetical protein [Delftia sp. PS-11]|uniref:hypothetical protein n=1 Tax=Delftia sp. PS-11 TaxID=2767222 RepID=UPI002453D90A|nr:hypothetical protein [Delftia sp. PS-11]KAJ8746240.1 hypothetical protein H9T68_03785 [Delftia sp. PS-11]